MATRIHAVRRTARINAILDEHAHLLLGFLKKPINSLGPKAAAREIRRVIVVQDNSTLKILVRNATSYFAKNGIIDPALMEPFSDEFLRELKKLRNKEPYEEYRRAS